MYIYITKLFSDIYMEAMEGYTCSQGVFYSLMQPYAIHCCQFVVYSTENSHCVLSLLCV